MPISSIIIASDSLNSGAPKKHIEPDISFPHWLQVHEFNTHRNRSFSYHISNLIFFFSPLTAGTRVQHSQEQIFQLPSAAQWAANDSFRSIIRGFQLISDSAVAVPSEQCKFLMVQQQREIQQPQLSSLTNRMGYSLITPDKFRDDECLLLPHSSSKQVT
jgi:hypothetical protein